MLAFVKHMYEKDGEQYSTIDFITSILTNKPEHGFWVECDRVLRKRGNPKPNCNKRFHNIIQPYVTRNKREAEEAVRCAVEETHRHKQCILKCQSYEEFKELRREIMEFVELALDLKRKDQFGVEPIQHRMRYNINKIVTEEFGMGHLVDCRSGQSQSVLEQKSPLQTYAYANDFVVTTFPKEEELDEHVVPSILDIFRLSTK